MPYGQYMRMPLSDGCHTRTVSDKFRERLSDTPLRCVEKQFGRELSTSADTFLQSLVLL